MTTSTIVSVPPDRLPAGLLIGGDWVEHSSGGQHEHIYPASGRTNAVVALAGEAEIDRAVRGAHAAQREWVALTPERRRDLLIDLADALHEHTAELGRLNVHDFGVPSLMTEGHVGLAESFIRFYAGYVDKAHGSSTPISKSFDINLIEREPYGVVGVIAPWNGALVVIGLNVAAALAAGNAVILKPSELAPFTSLRFGEICLEAGLPAGLVNVLPAGPAGGEALVRHPGVGKIHFTGGGHTARKVLAAAAANLTPVATELGGKSANLVFADADLDRAARLSAFQGPLGQAGQSCACGSRILVQDSAYDAFLEKLVGIVESVTIGDPFDPHVVVGPVISAAAADRIVGVIDRAVSDGSGELVTGGTRIGGALADGYFLQPTVFANVDNRSQLAAEETFGPVVSVIRFHDEAEAIEIANDTTYGLNAYVQTNDLTRAHSVARQLQAGSIWINRNSDIQPQGPYGGYKQSGSGRAGGEQGLHEFQQVKNIRIGMS
ncbi:aldehyde dehydrogenase family protein [Aldersonia kunmingensis]|uniref:aldehyde dehydrogenase family protein n=1 Tax=Aldersonia kunmingensis TaxID=408066 RepID=UPI00082CA2B8|nr:aldehyde dehydrogenase family protein [Aldersonia kunmingensis]